LGAETDRELQLPRATASEKVALAKEEDCRDEGGSEVDRERPEEGPGPDRGTPLGGGGLRVGVQRRRHTGTNERNQDQPRYTAAHHIQNITIYSPNTTIATSTTRSGTVRDRERPKQEKIQVEREGTIPSVDRGHIAQKPGRPGVQRERGPYLVRSGDKPSINYAHTIWSRVTAGRSARKATQHIPYCRSAIAWPYDRSTHSSNSNRSDISDEIKQSTSKWTNNTRRG